MRRMLPLSLQTKSPLTRSLPWTAAFLFMGMMIAGMPQLQAQDCDPSGVTQAAVICDGGLASFVVSGLDPNQTYDVDFDTNNGGPDGQANSLVANGAGEVTIVVTMTAVDNGSTFAITKVERTSGATCVNTGSAANPLVSTTVQVNTPLTSLTVTNDPASPVCLNTTITHTATAVPASPNNGSYTYAWAGCNGVDGAGGCPGLPASFTGTGAVVTRTWGNAGAKSAQVIVGIEGCPAETAYVNFTVSATAQIAGSNSTEPSVCSGATLSINPANNIVGSTVGWDLDWATTSGAAAPQSGTGTINSIVTNNGGAQIDVEYTVTPVDNTGGGCSSTPFTITVPVDAVPTGTPSATEDTICSVATPTPTYAFTVGEAYSVTSVASGVSGNTASATGKASGSAIETGSLSTTGNTSGTVTYTITPYNFGDDNTDNGGTGDDCPGAASVVTVTVEPVPDVAIDITSPQAVTIDKNNTSLTATVCNGTVISGSTSTLAVPSGTNAVWVEADIVDPNDFFGLGGTGIHHLPVSSATFTNIALTISGTASQTLSGTITPYIETDPGGTLPSRDVGECTGTVLSFNITILPTPAISPIPATEVVCTGNSPLTAPTLTAGDRYLVTAQLISGTATGFSPQRLRNGGDAIDDGTLINTGNIDAVVRYTITPYNFGPNTSDDSTLVDDCLGSPTTIDVTVRPVPNYSFSIDGVAINDGTPTVNLSVCDVVSNVPVTPLAQGTSSIAAAKLGVRFEATGTNLFLGAQALSGVPYVVQGSMAGFNATPLWSNQPLALRLANNSLTTPQTATFKIIAFYDENENGLLDNNECEGATYTATITVNPVPEVSIVLNGTTVTADNDLLTPDNVYTFEVCDTADNVIFTNKQQVISTPNTWLYYEVLSSTNVNAPGTTTVPFASFPTGPQTISLVDPTQPGQVQVRVTPFNELGGPNAFDPATDCGGEPILVTVNVNPIPAVSIDVNGTTVTSDVKDSGNDTYYTFDLCKSGPTNITLDNLTEINTTDSSRVQIRILTNTNTNGDPAGTIDDEDIDDLAAATPINLSLNAINTALPGIYEVEIIPYRESGDAAGLDAQDCAGEPDTVRFNVVSSPEISIIVNNTTVTADNNLATPDNVYAFTVCDVDNNLDLSSIATVVNSPNTYLRTEIAVNNNTNGDPQSTIASQPLSFFQSQLPATASLRLVNTADTGVYRMLITPFFESGDQAGLDANDCPGEQISVRITVIPTPDISLDINGNTLSTDNDGNPDASESVSFKVCDGTNNVTFSNLSQDNSSPDAALTVAFTTVTNVTIDGSAPVATTSPLAPLVTLLSSPQSIDLELITDGTPGLLEGYFLAFTDGPNGNPNNVLDPGECTADTLFFSIIVNPRPEISMTVAGNALDNVGTNNGSQDGNENLALTVCTRMDSIAFSQITNANNTNFVGVEVDLTATNINFGGPLPTFPTDEKLALFNAQLPALSPFGFELTNPNLPGDVTLTLTPFHDENDNGDLDPGECTGDPLTVTVKVQPIPHLSIDINGQTVVTDNDPGTTADQRDTIQVCNLPDNLNLSVISRVGGVNLGSDDWVQINVTASGTNNPIGGATLTAQADFLNANLLPLLTTLSLNNPQVPGQLDLEIIPFNDGVGSTPGVLDNEDCRAEGGILTIMVGTIPPDLSEDLCTGCGEIRVRYCFDDPNPEPLRNSIIGPTNTNPTYESGDTLRWYDAASGGNVIPEPTPNTSLAASEVYWVTQVNPNTGCESVNRTPVRVIKRPEVTLTVAQPTQPVCEGDPLDLFAQITGSSGNANLGTARKQYHYLQGSDSTTATDLGFSLLAGPSPATTADPNNNIYWIYRLDEYGINPLCASDTLRVTYTVNPAPAVNAAAASLACTGDTIFLFENGGDAIGWSWNGPAGFTSSQQNDTIANATTANEGRYFVAVADANGCTNIDSVDVAFQTLLDLALNVSDTLYCPPAPANAEITVESAEAGVSYIIEELPAGTPLDTLVGTGNDLTFTFPMPGSTTFYQIVAEAGGCRDTLIQQGSVSPTDTVKPVLVCPADIDVIANTSCVTLTNYTALATVTDNCATGLSSNAQFPPSGTTIQDTTEVTLFADDGNGNIGFCTFNVNVVDNTAPVIAQCPPNQFTNVNVNCDGIIINYVPTVVVTDNCDPNPTVSQSPQPGTIVGLGQNTVTITATDFHGQSSSCFFTVTVQDQTPPTIICPSDTSIALSANNCTGILPNFAGLVNANDNCTSTLTPQQSPAPGSSLGAAGSVIQVTMTVMDQAALQASCTFNVTAIDTFPPVVLGTIVNQTIYRGMGCAATMPDYTATGPSPLGFFNDNCDGPFAAQTQFPPAGVQFFIDTTITVTLFATDQSNNVGTTTFQVTVVDTMSPMISCPQNDTVSVDANCQHTLGSYSAVTVMDNCGPVTVTQAPAAGITVANNTTITLTATDTSNNTGSCTLVVVLEDNTNPTIFCPGNQTVTANAQCNFLLPDYTSAGIANDNCGATTITQSPVGGSFLLLGANAQQNVTLTATDGSGNSAACSFTVTLIDLSDPTIISCAPDTFIYADVSCNSTLGDYRSLVVATDNCGSASLTVSQVPQPGFPIISGANSVTQVIMTVSDVSGNLTDCILNVTVIDTTSPSIICPSSDTVATQGTSCEAILPDYTAQLIAADNCGSVSMTQMWSFGDTAALLTTAPYYDTLYVWDQAGLTLLDKREMTLSGFSIRGVTGLAVHPLTGAIYAIVHPGSSNFRLATLNPENGVLTDIGPLGDRFAAIAFDPAGRLFGVTGDGATTPETLYDIDPNTAVPTLLSALGNGNDGEAIAFNPNDGFLYHASGWGTGSVVFEKVDTATFTTTNVPLSGPVTSNLGALMYIGGGEFLANHIDAGGSIGNAFIRVTSAGAVTLTGASQPENMKGLAATVLGGFKNGPITFTDSIQVKVVAQDNSGNTDTCVFYAYVADSTAPEIICMGDTTVDADANCQGQVPDFSLSSVTATDNCDDDVTITQSIAAGTNFNDSVDVQLVATDDAGNTDTCMVTVYAEDNTGPDVTCPLPQQIATNGICQAILPNYLVQGLAFANDNCTPIDTIFQFPAPGSQLLGLSTFTISVTAQDTFGNIGVCQFTVTTIDTTAPSILCPVFGNDTLQLDANCEATMQDYTAQVSANDNCSNTPFPTISQFPLAGATLSGAGSQTVTMSATDESNNVSTCTFTLVLEDNIAPTISCAGDTTVYADANCQFTMLDFSYRVQAGDNCDQPVISQLPAIGAGVPLGDTTIWMYATDLSGNVDSCSFVLTVADTTSPVIICPNDTVAAADANCQAVLDDYTGKALVTDNCSQLPSVTQSPAPGTVFGSSTALGDTVMVTLTATDTAGNQSSCVFKVAKKDTTPPSISCPTITYTVTADANCNGELADYRPVVTVSDNCSPVNAISITQSPDSGTFIGGIGNSQQVTMTATDEAGNSASCILNVTVVDLTPPSFTCPDDSTVYVDNNCDAQVPDFATGVQAGASDNCSAVTVTQRPAAGTTLSGHQATASVKLFVADNNGNVDSTCTVIVTALDTIKPTFTCPAADTVDVLNNGSCDSNMPDYSSLVASDNCAANVTITQLPLAGTLFTTVDTATVYFSDGNGNMDSCSIRVVVGDTIAPSIDCPNDTTVYADAFCFWSSIDFSTLSTFNAADNCDPSLDILQAPVPGVLFGKGVTPVTMVATDDFNNSRFCVFNVTVLDTTGPIMTCPSTRVLTANASCQAVLPDYRPLTTSFDNCDGARPINQSLPAGINVTGGGGPITLTMTSSDTEGNTSSCSFDVILADNLGPTISGCPNDTTVYVDGSCDYVLPDFTTLITAVDGCGGGVTKTQIQTPGASYTVGDQFTVNIVAADVANNQNTCNFLLTVADSTKPVIVCNPITVFLDPSGNYNLDNDDFTAMTNGSTDNCTDSAGLTRFVFPNTFSCADVGNPVSVVASISDASANVSNCTTLVTVQPSPLPGLATILTPDTSICEGDTLPLRATAATGTQTGQWSLSTTGTFLPNDQDSLADLADLPAGVHTLVWTITDNCAASADTITVTVNARPMIVANQITQISAPGASDGEVEAVAVMGNPIAWTWSNGAPSNDTAFNLSSGTYWVIGTDANGCSSDSAFITLFDPAINGVAVDIRVALEGPYDSTQQLMEDNLRQANLIPTTNPYNIGGTVPASRLSNQTNPAKDVVDWVLVQLWDSVGSGNGGYGNLVATQAGILLRDGTVVGSGTNLPLEFPGTPAGAYHVVVKHRNHLRVGTDQVVNLTGFVSTVDFFNGTNPVSGGVAVFLGGKVLMPGGDLSDPNAAIPEYTGDGSINPFDTFRTFPLGRFNLYDASDVDMNGQVDANDAFFPAVFNSGKFTLVP